MLRATAILALVALGGCIGLYAVPDYPIVDPTDRQAVARLTRVAQDSATAATQVAAPYVFEGGDLERTAYLLRGWRRPAADGPAEATELVVAARLRNVLPRLDAASAAGVELETRVLARELPVCGDFGCSVSETVAVALPAQLLETAAAGGLAVELRGEGGTVAVTIPGPYVQGFLDAYARAVAGRI